MSNQEYLEIGFGKQRGILEQIKKHSKLTWEQIATIIGVKKRTVYCYLNETARMPVHRLIRLCKKTNFDSNKLKTFKTIKMKKYRPNIIIKPQLDEHLSEFLGVLSGDGNADPDNYRINISCDATTDYEYMLKIVQNQFVELFNLESSIHIQDNTIHCRVYSKELVNFLDNFSFPKGNRKNRTLIPEKILENKKLLIPFLRGVFDTDGSIHRKRSESAVVEFISRSPAFLEQIKNALILLGFNASLSGKSVYIYDQRQVDTFFNVVKPNNPKHKLKYALFKEIGRVILQKEVEEMMLERNASMM